MNLEVKRCYEFLTTNRAKQAVYLHITENIMTAGATMSK